MPDLLGQSLYWISPHSSFPCPRRADFSPRRTLRKKASAVCVLRDRFSSREMSDSDDCWSDVSDTSSDSGDSDGELFFGPMATPLLHEGSGGMPDASDSFGTYGSGAAGDHSGRKRRAVEIKPRVGRYDYDFDEGDMRRWRLDADRSPWWAYINHPDVYDESSSAGKRFREKFRLPKVRFDELVAQAQNEPQFADKSGGSGHGKGPPRHPLVLKVCAVLRHLGKGMDPESLEDVAQISASSLKVFIPEFLAWMVRVIYPEWVKIPEGIKLLRSLQVYEQLGFPGAFCSADGVHVPWDRAPSSQNHIYVGKEGFPTLAFVVAFLHSREVIHVDEAVGGAMNDKTQAHHSVIFDQLRSGTICPDLVYYLYDENGQKVAWKGVYAIVDNGFHQWRCLQAPLKHACGTEAALWSKRLESVRKDSECGFGTLKKRFRVLRLPFLCNTRKRIDDTFRACAALHNLLLHHDNYHSIGHRVGDYVNSRADDARRQLDFGRLDRTAVRAPDALLPGVSHKHATRTCTLEGLSLSSYVVR